MALGGLDSALSGLRIAQRQLDVISNNVSNVSTPGFTRKILPQETVTIDGQTAGVRSRPIIRNVDLDLERDLWTQVSTVQFNDIKATYLNRIQQFHGPPDLEVSIAAEIAELRDDFAALSDSPEDDFLLRSGVDQAATVASKLNDFADMVTEMRNDTQDEIALSVTTINQKLEQIAALNKDIKLNKVSGKSTAALEDFRDQAIKELSQELEISFFTRGDGVMVIQTNQGIQLADERAETIFFNRTAIGPTTLLPDPANPGIGGIFVGGDPAQTNTSIEITSSGLNGRLGALLDMRDEVLPRQLAQADELAHKLALRFNAQGLRLFTDAAGAIPLDTAPDPSTNPPTPVEYVGFAGEIQVNVDIINDNTLLRTGTVSTDLPVQSGSNEVVRRVVEFVFGDVEFQEAVGNVDLRASTGATTLQEWLGVFGENQVTGRNNISNFADITALLAAGGEAFDPNPPGPPLNDEFTLTFEESRAAPPLGPTTITLSLTAADANFPIGGGITNAADQIVAEINNQIALAGIGPGTGLGAVASLNGSGQLIIESHGNITVDTPAPGGMAPEGLAFIGLENDTYATTDPWIEVQVGNDPPVRITIEPGEDETDLIAKLDKISAVDPGVPGLAVDLDVATGFLTLRPGDSTANPTFGGDINILGGPFSADGSGTIPGGVVAGTGLIETLFGSPAPITNTGYASPTSTPGVTVPFRTNELGPGANISTGIISSFNLIDYSQKMVNRQTEEINTLEAKNIDEKSYKDLLEKQLLDESGINLDEELSHMILVQTAFSAAARVVSAIDEQFQELLRAF